METLLTETFNGDIWRMDIDETSDNLLLEIRDGVEKQVSFASINLTSGNVWFKNLTTQERWLTGIEVSWDGVLLLHDYLTDTGPIHKGLIALDEYTGETLWSDYTSAFDHLSVNGPVIYDTRIHPRKLFLKDVRTGATTRIYEPSVYREPDYKTVNPEILSAEELAFKVKALHPYGNTAHYLEHHNYRILSLHTLSGGALNQLLYVFDGDTEIYRDLLNAGIQKMQPEAFMIHKNRLIFIKNKLELKILSL